MLRHNRVSKAIRIIISGQRKVRVYRASTHWSPCGGGQNGQYMPIHIVSKGGNAHDRCSSASLPSSTVPSTPPSSSIALAVWMLHLTFLSTLSGNSLPRVILVREKPNVPGSTPSPRRAPNDIVSHDAIAVVIWVAAAYSPGANAHNPNSSHMCGLSLRISLDHISLSYSTLDPCRKRWRCSLMFC